MIHDKGSLKKQVVADISKYIKQLPDLPRLLDIMREHGKKIFLLTNSEYSYSNSVMEYLFAVPTAHGRSWQSYFDFIVVDACKPLFFSEGTFLRQLDIETGTVRIGLESDPTVKASNIYSGGNCDLFTKLINAKGRDVLYCGDHVYGDILKSKKTRGWRTFLLVPELDKELHVWTSERDLFDQLTGLDATLANIYKNMDSSSSEKPDLSGLKKSIRETIHKLDMSYGKMGSMFRCGKFTFLLPSSQFKLEAFNIPCQEFFLMTHIIISSTGSRQTHFAYQLTQYADLYARSVVNLIYYPLTYLFRASPTLLPHESTVVPTSLMVTDGSFKVLSSEKINRSPVPSDHGDFGCKEKTSGNPKLAVRNSSLPHPSPAIPTEVTHHHDTDEDDSSGSNSPVGSVPEENQSITYQQ